MIAVALVTKHVAGNEPIEKAKARLYKSLISL